MWYWALKGPIGALLLATPWGKRWKYRREYNRLRASGVDRQEAADIAYELVYDP